MNLKLDPYDKSNLRKNLVRNQFTPFDSSRFSQSDCESSPVKTYANKRILLEEKKVAHTRLEPATLGSQALRFPNWARRADM